MWNLKYDTDDLIYEIERRSRTHGTDCWLPMGMGNGGRMEGEVGVSRCEPLHIGGANSGAYCGAGSCIRSPGINHGGK